MLALQYWTIILFILSAILYYIGKKNSILKFCSVKKYA